MTEKFKRTELLQWHRSRTNNIIKGNSYVISVTDRAFVQRSKSINEFVVISRKCSCSNLRERCFIRLAENSKNIWNTCQRVLEAFGVFRLETVRSFRPAPPLEYWFRSFSRKASEICQMADKRSINGRNCFISYPQTARKCLWQKDCWNGIEGDWSISSSADRCWSQWTVRGSEAAVVSVHNSRLPYKSVNRWLFSWW
jgi:hypothetical protein